MEGRDIWAAARGVQHEECGRSLKWSWHREVEVGRTVPVWR